MNGNSSIVVPKSSNSGTNAIPNGSLGSASPDAPVPYYPVPRTKEQLFGLLSQYQQLSKSYNQAKARHEQYVAFTESKISGIMSDDGGMKPHVPLEKSIFVDPTRANRSAIEDILRQVSHKYETFTKKEADLYLQIKQAINSLSNEVDSDLLKDQIIGLQLLSKDIDLPETLQTKLSSHSEEGEAAKEGKLVIQPTETTEDEKLAASLDNAIEQLTKMSPMDSFVDRIALLGINLTHDLVSTPESITANLSEPTLSNLMSLPLGNYKRETCVSAKLTNIIKELESIPANIGSFDFENLENPSDDIDSLKLDALIELKSLRVLAKQKSLRKAVVVHESSNAHNTNDLAKMPLISQSKRAIYVRPKYQQPNPHLLAVQLEEKQKLEAKRKKHLEHVEKVRQILESSINFINGILNQRNKRISIGKFVTNFHAQTEKDELRKLEKTAKQRLQALKANDEEAYIKLLDQTKDHRITHLLKQTNQFLDTLAQQVRDQQAELGADIPLLENDKGAKPEEIKEDSVEELREKIDYYQVAHRIKEEVKVQPSILVGGKLKDYQLKGLQWMVSLYNNKLNGILADEMGLGKTIQSISLISYLIEIKHEEKFLVIVPLSTITNWTLEFEKWAPSINVIVYKGSQEQRKELQMDVRIGNFQVMLTTYEYIIRERPLLAKFNYSHMIIDEGHRMKNANSKLSITLRNYYKTKNRLILTGTPLQNNLPELWALLNFVLPRIFNSVKSFDEWFNTPFANTGSQEKIELTEEESLLVIRRLHKVLRPFLLRRLKKDVEKDLPDKVEKVIKCKLSGLQYVLYQQMLKHNAFFVGNEGGGAAKTGIKGLNNKIMQLRKICNHPFVFPEVETILSSLGMTNDLIWRTSGKFELLDRILPKFKALNHRVLMFFQMTQVMTIMEDFLIWRGMKYLRLDGSTKAEDRQDMLKEFNAPNSEYFCFLLSTRAGGLGLNLQTADTVIIFDTDWNPHQDLQAQDRAHRIGQKNEVRILRLITNDSVEEVILERAHQKLDIDGKVIQAGKFDNKSTSEEQEAFLKRLLEAEATRDSDEEKSELDDDELNDILARNDDERELFANLDVDRMAGDKQQMRNGIYSTRLIEIEELPSVFTEDITKHMERETKDLSRMREKKRIRYDDGLTEEQWLNAMDDDNDTVEDAIRRKELRKARRIRNGSMRGSANDSMVESGDVSEVDEQPRKRSRRSRSASATPGGVGGANGFVENEDDVMADVTADSEDGSDVEVGGSSSHEYIVKCNKIIEEISNLKAPTDGHGVIDVFMSLPLRKVYPDYYQIIKRPVSINQVKKLLKQEKFELFEEFIAELQTMVDNAKTYNESGSWVYDDALAVENVLQGYRN
ncbi:RSC chromatin remodeling complex ATPase component [Scheffersomyces spartinae]|uniref:RSC chromatin remodeling complex ATPase component n=1 Tax=Scheffersomyces spartinae TaxID=45513 RepID=A0A9P7V9W1_9ASCO|nr:RSC chromatin remodeling complex ATPase component [Scheffersomyces spartinae]KAG7193895.1 RSC chromatin remodeling complex ATPase component [Scheffersomyces spartinae]